MVSKIPESNDYKWVQTMPDKSTLFKKKMGRKETALIVYVDDIDDIIVTGNDEVEVAQLKNNLAREIEI